MGSVVIEARVRCAAASGKGQFQQEGASHAPTCYGSEVAAPKGTIYVWAPVPAGHTSTSFAELVLEEAAVIVSPGSMYGPSGEGFFRISLTTPDDRISEAVERMREHLS